MYIFYFNPAVSSQTPQQIQIAHMQQQSGDQMAQPMVMPVVSMPGITSCQSGPLLVMQQQQQPTPTQLQQQMTQPSQPQQQTQNIVSTDGTAVTLAQNTQPLSDVAVSMQGMQQIAPPIIPPPASVAIKPDDLTSIAGSVTSVDSSTAPVVVAAPAQPPSVDSAATAAAQMAENKAEAIQGNLTLGASKVDNGE